MLRPLALGLAAILVTISFAPASAQLTAESASIQPQALRNGLYMFIGFGGNIAVTTGDDGVAIVDDQFAPMTSKIEAAIAEISDKPLQFVINTHWHWDHTGGNENFGKAGKVIIAHDNTFTRMSTDQYVAAFDRTEPAAAPEALPRITFNDTATMHFNDLTIRMIHVPNAHTDTDAFVHFVEANVIHTGDVYVTSGYPFIDTSTGGTLHGAIAALEKLASIIDDETLIIPGHGSLSNKERVLATIEMLKAMRIIGENAVASGMTLEEFLASSPTKDFDPVFGQRQDAGVVFATRLYLELSNAR